MAAAQRIGGVVAASLVACAICLSSGTPAHAAVPPPGPQSGSAGLQGKVQTPPPAKAATIATPSSGQSLTKMPVPVNGLCSDDLLVKVFANNVFVGSTLCQKGSYSLQIDLFDGRNDLVARVFDQLDQAGPDSNVVTLTYTNSQFASSGAPLLSLTSAYGRKGASPGEQLVWPITISGGTAPYALSVDWGDGKGASLHSAAFPGPTELRHVYEAAGVYAVIVKATDKNGQAAYLQLVGQGTGALASAAPEAAPGSTAPASAVDVVWLPAALTVPLLFVAFWLGKRFALVSLRRHLERPRD